MLAADQYPFSQENAFTIIEYVSGHEFETTNPLSRHSPLKNFQLSGAMNELSPSTAGFRLIRLTKPTNDTPEEERVTLQLDLNSQGLAWNRTEVGIFFACGRNRHTPDPWRHTRIGNSGIIWTRGGGRQVACWDLLLNGKNYATRRNVNVTIP